MIILGFAINICLLAGESPIESAAERGGPSVWPAFVCVRLCGRALSAILAQGSVRLVRAPGWRSGSRRSQESWAEGEKVRNLEIPQLDWNLLICIVYFWINIHFFCPILVCTFWSVFQFTAHYCNGLIKVVIFVGYLIFKPRWSHIS